jgi:hypothetical protein
MPSHPPETGFYQNDANYQLWRDVTSLYEAFVGDNEADWPEKRRDWERVMSDIAWRLEPWQCEKCGTTLENAAPDNGTQLQCPICKWTPITVTGWDASNPKEAPV